MCVRAQASARIEQQELQIATLQGRSSALKVASEEASAKGAAWSAVDVKRFSALPKSAAAFTDDTLREMLDQAVRATQRRVAAAVADGARARADAERAEGEGDAGLEEAFNKCKDPTAEHAVRQAVRAALIRQTRCANKLRYAHARAGAHSTSLAGAARPCPALV